MEHETFLAHITEQSEALRAAAVAAGPSATVPTCPKWTVEDLVGHIAVVHAFVRSALGRQPDGNPPSRPTPPSQWAELLDWWDSNRTALTLELAEPDKPAWMFGLPGATAASWARRQAHETAIHRLDAEHAHAESVPTLLFSPELAADGIDEVLVMLSPRYAQRVPVTVEGTLLVHAADAGRAWLVEARDGVVEVGPPVEDPATDADATLAGTADAVYRAVWKRPSTAILNGREEMLTAVNAG